MSKSMSKKGLTLWFTGLSGAGKTTIAQIVAEKLRAQGLRVELLDGDVLRQSLTKDLGFNREDRDENIRRIANLAKTLTEEGAIVLVSVISPYREARRAARETIGSFAEVYVDAPLEVCEGRDVKGLYRKARSGEIKGFTGIDDPYEIPQCPELVCYSGQESVEISTQKVIGYIGSKLAPALELSIH
jgi:adenylylsulfate kinase